MTWRKREIMEMAREAGFPMAWISDNDGGVIRWKDIKAFEALVRADEQALAAQQEPVELPCCGYTDASAVKWNPFNGVVQCHNCGQAYTTSPQRTAQPAPVQEPSVLIPASLAEKQFERYYRQGYDAGFAAQPEQEPVTKVTVNAHGAFCTEVKLGELPHGEYFLYTTPPHRTWVGLTDKQKQWIKETEWTTDELIEWINTKLRSKNEHRG